jgi:hypothetical protein
VAVVVLRCPEATPPAPSRPPPHTSSPPSSATGSVVGQSPCGVATVGLPLVVARGEMVAPVSAPTAAVVRGDGRRLRSGSIWSRSGLEGLSSSTLLVSCATTTACAGGIKWAAASSFSVGGGQRCGGSWDPIFLQNKVSGGSPSGLRAKSPIFLRSSSSIWPSVSSELLLQGKHKDFCIWRSLDTLIGLGRSCAPATST